MVQEHRKPTKKRKERRGFFSFFVVRTGKCGIGYLQGKEEKEIKP